MKQISRSEFLENVADAVTPVAHEIKQQGVADNPFYNTKKPVFASRSSTTTGLTAYTGVFGTTQLSHLLRRTMFGLTQADLNFFAGQTLSQVMATLLTPAPTPAPPVNAYSTTDADVPFGQTWVTAPLGTDGTINAQRRYSFKQWWVGLMLNQTRSLTEKMTLFFHNFLATQTTIISDARYCYANNALLRANSLGNFQTLLRAVTTDPGMLVYLNGNTNIAGAPNENYGREMQELFTVGKGPDSLYTQADVEAAARVLTGWKDNSTTISSVFNPSKHDTTDKQFSAFYNNTVIKGQTGANGADETDELIAMVFAQPECAKFFSRKLYTWFVYYDIDQSVEDNIITPLSQIIIESNYDIIPALATLLMSEHFFDPLNMGCMIKNPVDHSVGMCRQFNVAFPDSSNLTNQYTSWAIAETFLADLAMDPGDPPNVAGWPAYYQEPQYHELWINSDTLPYRTEFSNGLSSLSGYQYPNAKNPTITLQMDLLAFAAATSNPSDPNQLIADSCALLSPNDLSYQYPVLKSTLLSGLSNDSYWTSAWEQYANDPTNQAYQSTLLNRLQPMYSYLLSLAEYQLA